MMLAMTMPQPGGEPTQYQARPYEQAEQAADALAVPAPQTAPPVAPAFGQPMAYHHVQPHSAGLAVVASFFIPGLGSMLNDKVGKGIGILACYIVAWVSAIVLIGFILAPAVWIWGMVTANNDANQWNRAHGILS
jgi:TM2 domain-containing membrane protein YozV